MATTKTTTSKPPSDPERVIADKITAAIEAGTAPWRKPWTGGAGCPFPLRATGERYRGINVLSLWLEASEKGYASPYWMTQFVAPGAAERLQRLRGRVAEQLKPHVPLTLVGHAVDPKREVAETEARAALQRARDGKAHAVAVEGHRLLVAIERHLERDAASGSKDD